MTTKSAQFTPGPWNAYNAKNGVIYKHWRVNTGTGLILLDDAAHWEAGNANLIAAAPAMYALLKRAAISLQEYCAEINGDMNDSLACEIEATIAQAEGVSHE